jgi:hypothetical protein
VGAVAGLEVNGANAVYRYVENTTTVGDFEAAIAASSHFVVLTQSPTPTRLLGSGNAIAPTALTGGLDGAGVNELTDDDYPFFIDFEPKKRELYESVTESAERLSGSGYSLSTTKGKTTTASLEAHKAFSAVTGIEASLSRQWVDTRTEDASTERRETQGRSTQLSQMYHRAW